jgi:hypothetical protein
MNAQGSSGTFFRRVWRWVRWPLAILLLIYIAGVIYRIPAVQEKQRSQDAVAVIQAQHLTMADVDDSHLPPPPDPALVDATIAGVDANDNGIRDDVELAIFNKYPGPSNIKIRAAELQYAMALQAELTKVFNTETWVAVAIKEDRGYQCVAGTYPREDLRTHLQVVDARIKEVEDLEFNSTVRTTQEEKNLDYTTSFGPENTGFCDLDSSSFD